ncbi:MAG: RES family NAD+ phosphorylase, partial [Actinomycetota bacterium]|nr:RES family NAD+ phosphorylase [Actinomycetota bacterium]
IYWQFPPRLLVSVRVNLARVLDLTDSAVLHQLEVSRNALFSPYGDDPDAPSVTQLIAIQARRSGIEALMAPSALYPEHHNLVVFRDNLHSPTAVEVLGFDDHVDAENADDTQ